MEAARPEVTADSNTDPAPAPTWDQARYPFVRYLTPAFEKAIIRLPLLNIDSLIIPSPYVLDKSIDIDYRHSYVWEERGELLGYMTVYATPDRRKFHIYRQVTSPFGRGKGIGTAFVTCLAESVPPDAHIYLYVWDRLISSIDFFKRKGFVPEEQVVYRKMKFLLMSVTAGVLRETAAETAHPDTSIVEELSKVRHDVKKSLRVLNDMAAMMSVDNFNRIVEDINRESRVMLNILNMYEDTVHLSHTVSLKEILTERVFPYIEAVDAGCAVRLTLTSHVEPVNGSYVTVSRALINIVANALDAIRETGRQGLLEFELAQQDNQVTLAITDNGSGIPADMLRLGPDRLPFFVGHTTKGPHEGEGLGTRQIYAAFGPDNIRVESEPGRFTRCTVTLMRGGSREDDLHTELGTRYIRFIKSTRQIGVTPRSTRTEIAGFIWQLLKMELFSYDLLYHFSRYNNVRDLFLTLLLYRFGSCTFEFLKDEVPNAFGLHVRYAMKANSDRTVLRVVTNQGLDLDCSSLDEAARAHAAGIPYSRMMLTTQEVPMGEERAELEQMIKAGLKYNVCSMLQFKLIADFAKANSVDLSMRVHPGASGGGESATRDTGSEYSCFGVHLNDVPKVKALADEMGLRFTQVHVHIGSGGDPEKWRQNIDRELGFVKTYFPDAVTVSFGGGLKVARMPGEKQADITSLGAYAKQRIEAFKAETGRELVMEIEPGTFVVANSGHIITRIIDKKLTNEMNFLIVDGGMELLTRPLLYGSEHPIAIVRQDGTLLSSEYDSKPTAALKSFGIVGRCCESGDSVRLDNDGNIVPVLIAEPEIGDYVVIGGTGAYSESMSPENYNSHRKPGAVMKTTSGELVLIRKKQVRAQLTQNELDVTL